MALTLEEMKANRRKWVEALRSEKYRQTDSTLFNDGAYCCLGVACVIAGLEDHDIAGIGNLSPFDSVREFYGIRDEDGGFYSTVDGHASLVDANDEGVSFSEIAGIIESEPEGLFVSAASSEAI
ncbi:MAG TPA: hypothetical protein VMF90_12195 [Rhizobiaceae bacterium]|nr:hypothetical protein [Rhizobiaceae bacterium]